MESDTNVSENYSFGEEGKEDSEKSDAVESDQPPVGKVRSIISRIENSFEPSSNDSKVRNGKLVLPLKDSPVISLGDDENSITEENINLMSPVSDGPSRRKPWFGSLTKRKSRESGSKRNSQFYSSPDDSLGCDNATLEIEAANPTIILSADDNASSRPESVCIESSDEANVNDSDSLYSIDPPSFTSDSDRLAFLTARELVTTEKDFIRSLQLLEVDFRNYVEFQNHMSKTPVIPPEDLRKLLNFLHELLSLNVNLHDDLEARLKNWETNPKISDVIVKKGAFLKIYGTYIENYQNNSQFLEECCAKYPKFYKVLKEFESQERCRKLTVRHYMLKPVQRIPQYSLLLMNYQKYLNEDSLDYDDTVKAISIVSEVNEHNNNRLKLGDKVSRMVQLQSMLSNFTLIEPGRELIKDGPLQKVCRKTVKDRYFILLNDCLIYSTPSKTFLNYHQTLRLGGMKVSCIDDDVNLYTFKVSSITKCFILCGKSEEERTEWVDALQRTIDDYVARQNTFANARTPAQPENFHLGKEAPLWVQDGKVTMCQICTAEFTSLFRRHHCRGCGKVICSNCGDNRAPLQYKSYKPQRVCIGCFDQLLQEYDANPSSIKQTLGVVGEEEYLQKVYLQVRSKFFRSSYAEREKDIKIVPHRLKEVTAKDSEADNSGWLRQWKSHKWKAEKQWYVLKKRVLYVYGASEDIAAIKTIPVLGYTVKGGGDTMWDTVRPELVFQLTHEKQSPIVFATECPETTERWLHYLTEASKMD